MALRMDGIDPPDTFLEMIRVIKRASSAIGDHREFVIIEALAMNIVGIFGKMVADTGPQIIIMVLFNLIARFHGLVASHADVAAFQHFAAEEFIPKTSF